MNITFSEALAQLNLQPGQSQRVSVNGYEVEIRRLAPSETALADMVMRQPWAWFPDPKPFATLNIQKATHPLPDPPVIPQAEDSNT